ncbi:MAG: hypothetical protein PHI22_03010 [Bacilli bacterium]|nr:hypothetical protein [Bacilli bacterium]MDD4298346.1 hypothetical protein [Bacilli bacterium]MDD4643814.1 hypothetical protein [Bacilli bacterium]
MLKKVLPVAFVFLFVLSGCGSDISKEGEVANKYNKSFESLYGGFCDIITTTGFRDLEELYYFYPSEVHKEFDNLSEEELKEFYKTKEKCTYKLIENVTQEIIDNSEKWWNEKFDTNREFLECKKVDVYFDDKYLDDSTACKVKEDKKWYIFEF